ncbi:hypothetical protein [Bacillus norwichensis]|uniref:Uncharacterized protein n=1 Tax=Bacillus norwichensis TaxID=2762217 RepID=A0ABR8VST9_9BACI|nr:hypothetical protein [Bacillus norwichensis]MBD8007586.1 hypothetical protein [Bacillus norwichensis]
MNLYQFKDVSFMTKGKVLTVENEEKERIGTIEQANISGCEKGHVFSFTVDGGSPILLGIKKRSIKNFFVATYVIQTEEKTYTLKDKAGNSLLSFCVEGNIESQNIRIEENWSQNLEIKVDQTHIATIKANDFTFKTTILMENNISESSTLFAITVLMYFMYKIYKNESEFIENILFD